MIRYKTLEWANSLSDIDLKLTDTMKAELLMVAHLSNTVPDFIDDISFHDDQYLSLAHALFPQKFENFELDVTDACPLEIQYIEYKLNGDDLGIPQWNMGDSVSDVVWLCHQIFFHTDFGKNKIDTSSDISRHLKEHLDCENSVDWKGEILLALRCIGVDIHDRDCDSHFKLCMDAYEQNEITLENYHPFVVFDMLKAVNRWH